MTTKIENIPLKDQELENVNGGFNVKRVFSRPTSSSRKREATVQRMIITNALRKPHN